MIFREKYTTQEKIALDKLLPVKDQTKEEEKTILSNEGYAITEAIEILMNRIMERI